MDCVVFALADRSAAVAIRWCFEQPTLHLDILLRKIAFVIVVAARGLLEGVHYMAIAFLLPTIAWESVSIPQPLLV